MTGECHSHEVGKMSMIYRWVVGGLCLMMLSACASWLEVPEDPPLPGERISVLLLEDSLKPNPEAAQEQIVLPPPSNNAAWPQTGGYANHAMHHIAIAQNPEVLWRSDIGSGGSTRAPIVAQPIVADGKIFTLDSDNMVSAYDVVTGDELWARDIAPEHEETDYISGGLSYDKGRLFIATGFALVYGLNAQNGDVLWTHQTDAPMRAAPTARGNRVFVITLNNQLIAIDGRNGKTLWDYQGISEAAGLLGGASPAVDQGVVVAAFSSGDVIALKVENGAQLWNDNISRLRRSDAISSLSAIRGRPIIDRGRVYVISNADSFVSLDLQTGRRYWSEKISSQETPWIAGDYLFVITPDAQMVALNRLSGQIHWVTTLPRWEDPERREGPLTWSGPILVGDRLIVAGNNEKAYSISPYDGRLLGYVDMPDRITVPPLVANGTLFFLSDDADLVAYR